MKQICPLTDRPEFKNPTVKRRSDFETKKKKLSHQEKNLPKNGSRLVITNLPLTADSDDMMDIFLKFGNILR